MNERSAFQNIAGRDARTKRLAGRMRGDVVDVGAKQKTPPLRGPKSVLPPLPFPALPCPLPPVSPVAASCPIMSMALVASTAEEEEEAQH